MLTQIVAVITALAGVGVGSWVSDWLKDRRARSRHQVTDESIVARTTVELLEPTRAESQRRLERIQFLKGVIRGLDDYADRLRVLSRAHGVELPPMDDKLRDDVDELKE